MVEVRGVDVYDPTMGEVRSSTVDDIACAYFTGAEDPYKSLKRALKADTDEEAWASLYRTRSWPFDPPSTVADRGQVINLYGDEVMKTYDILGDAATTAASKVAAS